MLTGICDTDLKLSQMHSICDRAKVLKLILKKAGLFFTMKYKKKKS